MVRCSPRLAAAMLGVAFLATACAEQTSSPDIVDAAALFEANEGAILSVRAAYPGPYLDFRRIPARNPADATKVDKAFLDYLRQEFPVEFIDFFPIGDTGEDEINVVLWRYEAKNNQWNTVSLIYFSEAMTFAEGPESVRSFDACDDDVRTWLKSREGETGVAAVCQINEHWRAYQRIE